LKGLKSSLEKVENTVMGERDHGLLIELRVKVECGVFEC